MNKPILVLASVLFFSTASLDASESQRYLIATKRPYKMETIADIVRDARRQISPRRVAGFETFHGFAAELTDSEVAELRRSPHVRWVEPVVERHALSQMRNLEGQTIPYGVDLIHARQAWAGKRTGSVNVVVLDTGVDYRHPELKDLFAGGFNLYDAAAGPMDDAGHGTHVAGTIAAADNTTGVVGIAPQAQTRLWAVKVLNSSGSGTNETVVKGIDWVVRKKREDGGNWIINMSLGSSSDSPGEREAIARATDAGILIVAASGNESSETSKAPVLYPAAYPGVVAVGAIDETEKVADFSNQGAELDVTAPGVGILSTIPVGMNYIGRVIAATEQFSAQPLEGSDSGKLTSEYVYCGVGFPEQFPPAVRGRIALIKRGDITFAAKARNAVDAGAIGVVIFNHNTTSAINWTLKSDQDPWSATYDFPMVVALSKPDGEALLDKSGAITITSDPDDYAVYNGTSMATPHVTGAAALIWSMAPNATAADVVNALTATAMDRGANGPDPAYGAGIIDVLAAARRLAPSAFTTGPTTGRAIGRRH